MAMIKCPECGGDVSDVATTCIHCGYPLKEDEQTGKSTDSTDEMKCPECGHAITDQDISCPGCGFPLKKKTKSKGTIVAIAVGIVAVLACVLIVIYFVGNANPVEKYIKDLLANNNDRALTTYNSKILGKSDVEAELDAEIRKRADATYEDFLAEKTSEDQAKLAINGYCESLKGGDYAKTVSDKIDNLATSRANYKQAVDAESNNEWQEAYKLYSEVIKDDPNYDTSQSKVDELKDKIRESYINQAEELVKAEKYDDAVAKIDEAIDILGSSTDLLKLKSEYDEKKYERADVDIRNVKWGDSLETAKRYERCEIIEGDETGFVVKDTLEGKEVWVVYAFNEDDQLYQVIYSFVDNYSNYDVYLSDYANIVDKLTDKYGAPSKVNDQRSSMANYCSTEGMALQLGYIAKESIWDLDSMTIKSRLYCFDDLTFLIGYQSKDIKERESKDNL
jgi:ribosomal protein L37E